MKKYAISSESAVLKSIKEDLGGTTIVLTTHDDFLKCSAIGEAMEIASKVNQLLGKACFSIVGVS